MTYKFKKVYVFVNSQKTEITDLVDKLRIGSFEDAQKFLKGQGFEYFMFTLEEVKK